MLTGMNLIGSGMELPENFAPAPKYQFNLETSSRVMPAQRTIIVNSRIAVQDEKNHKQLAWLSADYWFELPAFASVITKDKSGAYVIPADLQLSLNGISISTSRGLLFSAFRGTLLHNAILPLVDPQQFETTGIK